MRLALRKLKSVLNGFQWAHQIIGVVIGITFFVGSIFFLYDDFWK